MPPPMAVCAPLYANHRSAYRPKRSGQGGGNASRISSVVNLLNTSRFTPPPPDA
ncbi:hypothetical protein IMZ48_35740 [Candidatus Bathyarchaeota archaeon]|nr:hypothetical protein [Candidatus Bathyarchaeota archaeon]